MCLYTCFVMPAGTRYMYTCTKLLIFVNMAKEIGNKRFFSHSMHWPF